VRRSSSGQRGDLQARQPAEVAGFDKQREELEKQTLEQKRTQAWDDWIQSQKLASKIDLSPSATAVR
jgi:hypothetical protein